MYHIKCMYTYCKYVYKLIRQINHYKLMRILLQWPIHFIKHPAVVSMFVTNLSFPSLVSLVPPSIEPISSVWVTEGNNLTLVCDASGIPEPAVKWTSVKSGKEEMNKTWTITNINRTDDGEYRCEATNTCGSVTRSTVVTVYCESIQYTRQLYGVLFAVIPI